TSDLERRVRFMILSDTNVSWVKSSNFHEKILSNRHVASFMMTHLHWAPEFRASDEIRAQREGPALEPFSNGKRSTFHEILIVERTHSPPEQFSPQELCLESEQVSRL